MLRKKEFRASDGAPADTIRMLEYIDPPIQNFEAQSISPPSDMSCEKRGGKRKVIK